VQWLALLIAACGVIYLTLYYGRFPWIAVSLAVTFAIYGLLHKKTPVAALDGLCLETAVVFPPALLYLLTLEAGTGGSFGHMGLAGSLLLAGAGVVTTIPLLLFGYAAQKIPLSSLGLLQYLAPSISLVIGVFVYGEDFSRPRMIGFCLIWLALAVYMAENIARRLRFEKKLRQAAR
jgi:chloramphenicol-sensitive protein RarD